MQQINLENKGLVFNLEGSWYEISSPEGVVESGSMDTDGMNDTEIIEKVNKHFQDFIEGHTVLDKVDNSAVKFVAWSQQRRDYIQLQAIKTGEADYYIVQEYNTELVFLKEHETEAWFRDEVIKYIKEKYEVQRGLPVDVFRSKLGDCTNGGISSERRELYIVGCETSPFCPSDVRECVWIESRDIMGETYKSAKPLYCRKRWYMAGGNFIYSSDSRYKEMVKISYPISVHDRYEGR